MTAAQVAEHARRNGLPNPLEETRDPAPGLLLVTSPERMDFFLEFEPPEATSQQKGERIVVPKDGGRPFVHHFTKANVAAAEALMGRMLLPFRPAKPFTGPLRFVAEWSFPWRASEPKRNRVAGWAWRWTAPDVENSNKLLIDVMAKLGFFVNDSNISDARFAKQWSDRPGIRITIEQLQQP